ncbi:MAG: exodeoxyribonuclease VII large subunit, partial [Acidobacteria bacterium]|nr:exodeoxyribonuclease VII large subunit [Acidobacteriota bacterium]
MTNLFDLPFEPPEEEPERAPSKVEGPPQAPAPRVWTVSALTAAIRDLLETRFAEVWIEGEISNCRPWHTGHLYFTLKDEGAQIKAVMFRSAARALRFRPEDGFGVLVRGRVGV